MTEDMHTEKAPPMIKVTEEMLQAGALLRLHDNSGRLVGEFISESEMESIYLAMRAKEAPPMIKATEEQIMAGAAAFQEAHEQRFPFEVRLRMAYLAMRAKELPTSDDVERVAGILADDGLDGDLETLRDALAGYGLGNDCQTVAEALTRIRAARAALSSIQGGGTPKPSRGTHPKGNNGQPVVVFSEATREQLKAIIALQARGQA